MESGNTKPKHGTPEYFRAWRKANPDKDRAIQKRYKSKNRESLQAKQRVYDEAHREEMSERKARLYRKRKEEDPQGLREHGRARHWKKNGWTPEAVKAAYESQDGCCWVCRLPLVIGGIGGNSAHADHNHETGKPRGLLCMACNIAEGKIKKTGLAPAEWASRLELYLTTFDEPVKEYGPDLKE